MKYRYWSIGEVTLLKKLYPQVRLKDLAKMFPDRNKATIVAKAKSLKLPSAKLWQSEENNILYKYFFDIPKFSNSELLRLLPKRSWTAILAQGERLGLKRNTTRPRIKVNENYFKKWSANMAYILGFILADGCIIRGTYKGYSDALKFGVQKRDIDILKKIKQELSAEHKISLVKNAAHLCISSQEIVNNLKDLSICYRKSLREKIPNIPLEYIADRLPRSLLRGICQREAFQTFTNDAPQLAAGSFTIYSGIHSRRKSETNRYLFSINYRCNSAKILIEYLYADAKLYLERKFNLAKRAMKIQMRKINNKHYAFGSSGESNEGKDYKTIS